MNTSFLLLLILSSFAGNVKKAGPCSYKFFSKVERSDTTSEFVIYLEMLLEERILTVSHLTPFLVSIEKNKIINPIPNQNDKVFAFHFKEFNRLIHSESLDLSLIKPWIQNYLAKKKIVETEKETSKTTTKDVPIITHDGAMFYKFAHPILGPSYKILKPGGRFENPADWEDSIWPIHPLKDQKGLLLNFSNDGEENSQARHACSELGGSIELPSLYSMHVLLQHFEFNKIGTVSDPKIMLTDRGRAQFQSMFTDLPAQLYWLSTPYLIEQTRQHWYFSGQGAYTDHSYTNTNAFAIRCIDKYRQSTDVKN